METLSERLKAARGSILSADVGHAPDLTAVISQFLPAPFVIGSKDIVDHEGTRAPALACTIYVPPTGTNAEYADIPADAVVTTIDVQWAMDVEAFRAAYRRVVAVKALKKRPMPGNPGDPNVILGIVFAVRGTMPMEDFARELEVLNAETPSGRWPDAVVLAATGLINYAVQFPGEKPSGNWLLARTEYAVNNTPPFYIPMMISPAGAHAFDKMLSMLLSRLRASLPISPMPDWDELQAGIPQDAIAWSGYQYNLRGELKPVPRDQYEDRALPLPVLHIRDKNGTVLAGVQFLPWQDGAVILLAGNIPMEMLYAFMDRSAIANAQVFQRDPRRRISSVLPLTRAEFMEALGRLQTRSNMTVGPDQRSVVVQKIEDEGTSSPFIARLMLGIFYLRNLIISDKAHRDAFDELHEMMTSHLFNARDSARDIQASWEDHWKNVSSGECVKVEGRTFRISENIDRTLRKEVDSFLNASARALKEGVQRVTKFMDLDIGFLFMKQSTFEARVTTLEATDPELAVYLRQVREWSEPLIESRIALEHGSWTLPKAAYTPNGAGVDIVEPTIAGQPMTAFVKATFDRLLCFAEEIIAYSVRKRLPACMTLTVVPVAQRTPEAPMRFLVTATDGGLPAWRLVFSTAAFESR